MAQHPVTPNGDGARILCPWCGAPNRPGAQRCASCGSWLVSEVDPANTEGETIIDVSSGEPVIVEQEPPPSGGFTSVWYSAGRGVVVRGGRRGCIIAAVVALLLVCSQCVIAYYVVRWIF